jgi:hypothetical protein
MKTAFFVFCFLCATAAVGQSAASATLSSATLSSATQMTSHDQHAHQHPLAEEQSLLEHFGYVYAQGERPLWEVGTVPQAVPLGDVARLVRKEHKTAKKADIVWNN